MTSLISDPTRYAFDRFAQGDLIEAGRLFREILTADPSQPDALHGMACMARANGQNAMTIALCGKALKAGAGLPASRLARIHLTLGLALIAEGHSEPARAALVVAQALQPSDPRTFAALGEALLLLGRRAEAKAALEQAAKLAANDAEYLTRLGQIHLEDGEAEQAIVCFEAVTQRCAQDGRAWANLGAVLFGLGQYGKAQDVLLRACELGARTAETLNNLGLVLMALGDLPSARAILGEALSLRPEDGRIANSLGTVLMEMGEEAVAETLFSAVMGRESGFDREQARFNHATLLLGKGAFAQGWKEFESRHALLGYVPESPVWNGSVGEAPIAVTAEQGLGDSVQFLRFLIEAAKRRPLRLRFPAAELVSFMPQLDRERILESEGPVESEVSLLSLPFVLGLQNVPDDKPYLETGLHSEQKTIGLCWAGNPSYRFDLRRSLKAKWLEPLKGISGIRIVSLQRGECPDWMDAVDLSTPQALARAVSQCALVISVDTLVAHMAGAVGRPLWLLNRRGGDWRWKDVPWYQNVRQFRPDGFLPEAWPPALEQVAEALRAWEQ
ncbi:O-linked N-acetylglucosamine transferase [Gluconobacter thailandicus F149-1 = NBRC 100600]|uniref:O-linked N-acetylglucosamine transferase n=1 Tax=Gluconobacter thailandicus NBRC 3257 TaxID=1381097 RepID=A0ABQ0J0C2_GLUTH|nr:tetratricopeptide repeat protein [Gluconobacter thailandicus]KXV52559.1 hypothetical protein AD946_12650 [Gluconobacter thailandicus]GAC87223.1 hypothetical protein NBRC3255_0884 [Gluconobacter thailandicus NBRC 3255]GAD27258.1 hypothetical protein NBRC3257_2257 [Gluconobacter thailandicus NBRC 3257]GAN94017.1 O-linked N-acetylglucosamine transferase [Gluconobacter thailandicus F149-1 = NBRC 100600]GBR60794.1 hypothetical protein AA100600_2304 [Gluconobacter thailandicus F149-1 = NBRC 10060